MIGNETDDTDDTDTEYRPEVLPATPLVDAASHRLYISRNRTCVPSLDLMFAHAVCDCRRVRCKHCRRRLPLDPPPPGARRIKIPPCLARAGSVSVAQPTRARFLALLLRRTGPWEAGPRTRTTKAATRPRRMGQTTRTSVAAMAATPSAKMRTTTRRTQVATTKKVTTANRLRKQTHRCLTRALKQKPAATRASHPRALAETLRLLSAALPLSQQHPSQPPQMWETTPEQDQAARQWARPQR